jgi:16S rRNA (uracil1498-N3)-methyltransferase
MSIQHYNNLKCVYCPENFSINSLITFTGQKLHHLLHVLRVRQGDYIKIFNESQGEWLAKIDITEKNKLCAKIIKQLRLQQQVNKTTLMFSPIKPDKLHFLVEKAVELGVNRLIPIITERSIVRTFNTDKINSYIIQAVEQSERLTLPKLSPLVTLNSALNNLTLDEQIIFCNEQETNVSLNKLAPSLDTNKNYIILIGPEGGFTTQERELLIQHKQVHSIHIGPRILRAETAALFCISCLQFLIGDTNLAPRS